MNNLAIQHVLSPIYFKIVLKPSAPAEKSYSLKVKVSRGVALSGTTAEEKGAVPKNRPLTHLNNLQV